MCIGAQKSKRTVFSESIISFWKLFLLILIADNDNGSNKDQIDEAVVYGLRARANLLMQKWADAAKDAERAIAGGTPQTLAQV